MNKKISYRIINLFVLGFLSMIIILLSITIQDDRLIVKLDHCIDGDTASLITNKGIESVRFLAIDTPETVNPKKDVEPYGIVASELTCNELKTAKTIELEFDINSDKYDKYNRLLAWIFVDNELLQSILISSGYAKVAYLYGDYKYTSILIDKEKIAKQKNLGLWYNN